MEAICSMYSEVLGQCLSRFWRELCNALAGIFRLAAKLYNAPVTAAAERAAINERAGYILDTYGDSILCAMLIHTCTTLAMPRTSFRTRLSNTSRPVRFLKTLRMKRHGCCESRRTSVRTGSTTIP